MMQEISGTLTHADDKKLLKGAVLSSFTTNFTANSVVTVDWVVFNDVGDWIILKFGLHVLSQDTW